MEEFSLSSFIGQYGPVLGPVVHQAFYRFLERVAPGDGFGGYNKDFTPNSFVMRTFFGWLAVLDSQVSGAHAQELSASLRATIEPVAAPAPEA